MRNIIWVLTFFSVSVFAQTSSFSFLLKDTLQAGDTLTVKFGIKKTGVSGFAKLEIYVPVGFTPCCYDQKTANVIYRDQVLKYIWIDFPAVSEMILQMKFVTDKRLYGKKEFYGSFNYILAGERKKERIPEITTFLNNPRKTDIPQHLLAIYSKKYSIPEPTEAGGDQLFRVQIGAFRKKVPDYILADFYSDTSRIMEEYTEGWYKYTVGYFGDHMQASDFRDKCGIPGAFVVKYEKGNSSKRYMKD